MALLDLLPQPPFLRFRVAHGQRVHVSGSGTRIGHRNNRKLTFADTFRRVNLQCDGANIVPFGAGFPETVTNTQQVCTLAGSTAGQNAIPGISYVSAGYDYARGHLWRNLGILIGFFIFFAVLQVLAMEVLALKAANVQAIVVFAKENKDTKARNERLMERKKAAKAGELDQDLEGLIESKRALTWTGLVSRRLRSFACTND
jgi:ATP-binding cassette subfamily G (WHITE) protein 2 (SNQ2)